MSDNDNFENVEALGGKETPLTVLKRALKESPAYGSVFVVAFNKDTGEPALYAVGEVGDMSIAANLLNQYVIDKLVMMYSGDE